MFILSISLVFMAAAPLELEPGKAIYAADLDTSEIYYRRYANRPYSHAGKRRTKYRPIIG